MKLPAALDLPLGASNLIYNLVWIEMATTPHIAHKQHLSGLRRLTHRSPGNIIHNGMYYNVKLPYTPALELHELNERALIIDTETVGAGPTIEVIEIAIGDVSGKIIFEALIRPVFNRLPSPSKHQRFDHQAFTDTPYWTDIWPRVSELITNKLLIAYNANFDRRALAAMAARHAYTSPERGWRCAMQAVKKGIGVKKSLTLSEACAHFGLEGGNHRAARDVLATCCLLQALRNVQSRTSS